MKTVGRECVAQSQNKKESCIYIGNMKMNSNEFEDEIIPELLKIEHVTGFNTYIELECTPVCFKNAVCFQNKNIGRGTKKVTLIANYTIEQFESFRVGNMVKTEGDFPSEKRQGVLIDQYLMKENHLKIGENIKLYSKLYRKQIELKIVGTYCMKRPPMIEVEKDSHHCIIESTSSPLFCDFNSYGQFQGKKEKLQSGYFYVDSSKNIEVVYKKMKEIVTKYKGYEMVDCLKKEEMIYGAMTEKIYKISDRIVVFTLVAVGIVLSFVILLWTREHDYIVGIYISLGYSRYRALFQCLVALVQLLIYSMILSLVVLLLGVYFGCDGRIYSWLELTIQKTIGLSIEEFIIEKKILYNMVVEVIAVYFGISVFSGIVSMFFCIPYTPSMLLSKKGN